LANKYRLLGESIGPVPYLVSTEEPLILEFQKSVIQGDPRSFLKQMAKKKMAEIWYKARQGEWFTKYPTQVRKQAKHVWKWSRMALLHLRNMTMATYKLQNQLS